MQLADLTERQVAVITSTGGTRSVMAAKAATSTIPIVFEMGGDLSNWVSSKALTGKRRCDYRAELDMQTLV